MPGRGGRSKACDNCYRRRIKCDETKPKCLKCAKAKLVCGGYKPLTIFSYDGSCEQWRHKNNDDKAPEPIHDSTDDQSLLPFSVDSATSFHNTRKALTFQLEPLADDVFVNYTLSNLLSAHSQHRLITGVYRHLSDETFLALATFFFGNEHKEREVVQHGLQRYGQVLRKLNTSLNDPVKWRTYDVLESVILATMFEYLMSDRPDGWIAHAIGIEHLFDCKGPKSFKSYAERAILERSRPSIIFASLAVRKPTILAKPRWKDVPWESAPEEKTLFERLVDIMADCPQLFVIQDKMIAAKGQSAAKIHACELCIKASTLRKQLEEWRKLWDSSEPGCRHEVSHDFKHTSGYMWKKIEIAGHQYTKFTYETLYHANAMTLYDATLILVEQILQTTIDLGSIEPQLVVVDPDSARAAVIDIMRSADYCIEYARGGLGSFYILFPIRVAWTWAYNRNAAVQAWLEATLRRIHLGAAGHWAIAGYLLNIASSSRSLEHNTTSDEPVQAA